MLRLWSGLKSPFFSKGNGLFEWPSVILPRRRRVGGTSCRRARAGQRAGRQLFAYLIRSRPSGRKINSLARCYCSAGGRAATRAQHNIYTVGPRRTLVPASAYTCCNAFRDAQMYTRRRTHGRSEAGVDVEKRELHLQDQQRLRSVPLRLCETFVHKHFYSECNLLLPHRVCMTGINELHRVKIN